MEERAKQQAENSLVEMIDDLPEAEDSPKVAVTIYMGRDFLRQEPATAIIYAKQVAEREVRRLIADLEAGV